LPRLSGIWLLTLFPDAVNSLHKMVADVEENRLYRCRCVRFRKSVRQCLKLYRAPVPSADAMSVQGSSYELKVFREEASF